MIFIRVAGLPVEILYNADLGGFVVRYHFVDGFVFERIFEDVCRVLPKTQNRSTVHFWYAVDDAFCSRMPSESA